MQTVLGENGGLVSGGEGQRVRFARALLRPDGEPVTEVVLGLGDRLEIGSTTITVEAAGGPG